MYIYTHTHIYIYITHVYICRSNLMCFEKRDIIRKCLHTRNDKQHYYTGRAKNVQQYVTIPTDLGTTQ
jgi:hypothetical protein